MYQAPAREGDGQHTEWDVALWQLPGMHVLPRPYGHEPYGVGEETPDMFAVKLLAFRTRLFIAAWQRGRARSTWATRDLKSRVYVD